MPQVVAVTAGRLAALPVCTVSASTAPTAAAERDQQGSVFGRFVRADNARAREIEGTGLGLFLCRQLVEHHGGTIGLASVEGQGTTFWFTLPLLTADAT